MSSLYEISEKYRDIIDEIDSCNVDDVSFLDTIESIGVDDEFDEKALNVSRHMCNVSSEIDQVSDAIKKMKSRLVSLKAKHKHIKNYIISSMKKARKDEIKDGYMSIKIKSCPGMLVIDDDAIIDSKYIKVHESVVVDKNAIKEDIKSGCIINGVRIDKSETLVVK